MIITSTHDIKDYKIKEYLGLINVNIVIGTNFFSDFFASVSDFFGGYSSSYQSKLDKIYADAINALEEKANYLRANGIIGVHFDFDEISGQGKQMFMVTAYGTAVQIEPIVEEIKKTERYEVYQKLYNLSIFKEKGIITEEQYEAEKDNLLLSHEAEIAKEIEHIKSDNDHREAIKQAEILSKQREEERQKQLKEELERQMLEKKARMTDKEIEAELRKEKEPEIQAAYDAFKTKLPTTIIKIRNLLESNVKSPKEKLNILSFNDIMDASYNNVNFEVPNNAAYAIGLLLKLNKVAEACKYYIDLVGDDDINEAKSYVNSIYDIVSFKNQSAFEKMAKNLIEWKCIGKTDRAIVEFSIYAVCDLDIARQVIEML